MTKQVDMPVDVKEKLLEFSRRLPKQSQGPFLQKVATRLSDLAMEHENTIIWAAVGWVLGEVIDNLFSVNVPFTDIVVSLTLDHAGEVGGITGALLGFIADKRKRQERERVAEIIGEELRRALSSGKA